ncbi:MAG: non-canonical purine NTP pyrophosphatase [Proteobacteria bacterium]|nr:non-canonical purine NTP pyrophosphatase [Pseudomonadota bacterium]
MGQRVILATGNAGKVRELSALLAPLGWDLVGWAPPVRELRAEEGGTCAGNAILKAEAACAEHPDAWGLADDSGLFVAALGGKPGVDTAHFGGPAALVAAMRDVPVGQRQAYFLCVLALARPGLPTKLFEARVEGVIALELRGTDGFGYDPVFVPSWGPRSDEFGPTNAELGVELKNQYSNRAVAAGMVVEWGMDGG